jgi:hypothetical protein
MALGYQNTLVNSQVDGTALTAAAAASAIPPAAKYTIPANYFDFIGKKLVVKAKGRVSTVATTPGTLRFDVRLGGIVVADSAAIALVVTNAYTTIGWSLEFDLTIRTIGTAAAFFVQGWFSSANVLGGANVAMPIGGVVAQLPWNTAPTTGTTFDSTVSNVADFFFTQTVATGSTTVHQYQLISPN